MMNNAFPSITTPDPSPSAWRKSSYSGNGTNCVEVADIPGGLAVRDSKDTSLPSIRVPGAAWHAFVQSVTTQHS